MTKLQIEAKRGIGIEWAIKGPGLSQPSCPPPYNRGTRFSKENEHCPIIFWFYTNNISPMSNAGEKEGVFVEKSNQGRKLGTNHRVAVSPTQYQRDPQVLWLRTRSWGSPRKSQEVSNTRWCSFMSSKQVSYRFPALKSNVVQPVLNLHQMLDMCVWCFTFYLLI